MRTPRPIVTTVTTVTLPRPCGERRAIFGDNGDSQSAPFPPIPWASSGPWVAQARHKTGVWLM